ncbi:hypothetical protein E5D57_007083 [Metarhizium anisopliae]
METPCGAVHFPKRGGGHNIESGHMSFVDPYFGARVVKQDISGTAVIGRVRAADGARPDVSPNIPLSGDGE